MASVSDERPGRPGSHSEWEALTRENAQLRAQLQLSAEREERRVEIDQAGTTFHFTLPI